MDVMPGCNTKPVLGVQHGAKGRPVFFFMKEAIIPKEIRNCLPHNFRRRSLTNYLPASCTNRPNIQCFLKGFGSGFGVLRIRWVPETDRPPLHIHRFGPILFVDRVISVSSRKPDWRHQEDKLRRDNRKLRTLFRENIRRNKTYYDDEEMRRFRGPNASTTCRKQIKNPYLILLGRYSDISPIDLNTFSVIPRRLSRNFAEFSCPDSTLQTYSQVLPFSSW